MFVRSCKIVFVSVAFWTVVSNLRRFLQPFSTGHLLTTEYFGFSTESNAAEISDFFWEEIPSKVLM
eukprot:TRINITY_DN12220_c0_g1_i1.p1 TRINITY_DN12220_c0_g1~~TRINITY_DN12220_c0_g1_i1.p1  ORF type:complete len:66 (+),score=7.66 TRINITY_DN12220_c0_g1_i1:28-225(+)